jgi:radical SAM protein with 4Fe4S-binding SPASM domain
MRPNLDYDIVIENIQKFIEIRNNRGQQLPLVRVSFLLNDINSHEADDFKTIWTKIADYVSIQRYVPISINPEDKLYSAIDKAPTEGKQNCAYPWESLFVHGDGVVVPCAAHRSRFISVGNINENTLYEIWHSDEMKQLRKALRSGGEALNKTKLCASCIR